MRLWLPLALLLAALAPAADASEMTLRVKPLLCITDERSPVCEMSFLVVWESAAQGYYCLFNDYDEEPVNCWTDASEGQLTDERHVHEPFSFWMTGSDTDERLAEVSVEVLRMDSEDRRRKRRTRHVWDIT